MSIESNANSDATETGQKLAVNVNPPTAEPRNPLSLCDEDCQVAVGQVGMDREQPKQEEAGREDPENHLTLPSLLPGALTPDPSPIGLARGTSGEGADPQAEAGTKGEETEIRAEEEWTMRSQSLQNLPPVVPWPEAVDGVILLDELRQLHGSFAVLPRWAPEVLALFVLHTYGYDLRDVSTYLGLESPTRRCGKTTVMTLLSELVNRPEPAANISPSAFFRVIDEERPTLLIDEADTLLPGNSQLRGILNAGYSRRMAYVIRVVNEREDPATLRPGEAKKGGRKGRGSRLARFSCWGPKVIAQIGQLPATLADRCIVIPMQRKGPADQCQRLQDLKDLEGTTLSRLRAQCARFVLDHAQEIARARPAFPSSLNDRAADISEPLLALADLAGGHWPKLARDAVVGLAASAEQIDPISILLLDILRLFVVNGSGRMFTRTLLEGLNALPSRPWAEARRGKLVTDKWLADQLRPYEIRSKTLWMGEMQGKGYCQEEFEETFRRYFPLAELEVLRAESPQAGVNWTSQVIEKTTKAGEHPKDDPDGRQGGEAAAA